MSNRECEWIESKVFPGPFVRVRGRVSRKGEVRWSPALRTMKGRAAGLREAAVVAHGYYAVDFLDYRGAVLESAAADTAFFSKAQEYAAFGARPRYHDHTQYIQLRLGERVLSRISVPADRPCFTLLSPGEDACINGSGVLHLRWCPHDSEYPTMFFVRYSHNENNWLRPGVNLKGNEYYLDLREMPGGKRCVVQILGTNGYRTSYVQTRYLEVPVKPPELLLAGSGPVLFAQGFSRQEGPVAGENLVWLIDGEVSQLGGTLDVRRLGPGVHQIRVQITDKAGIQRTSLLGRFDSATGQRVEAPPL